MNKINKINMSTQNNPSLHCYHPTAELSPFLTARRHERAGRLQTRCNMQHAICHAMPCHARPKRKVTVRCTYVYRAVIPLVSHQPLYFSPSSKFLHLRWIIITRSHALPRFLHYCTFLASESSESIPRGYLSACPEGFRNPFVNAVCSPLAVVCGLVSPELPKSPVI